MFQNILGMNRTIEIHSQNKTFKCYLELFVYHILHVQLQHMLNIHTKLAYWVCSDDNTIVLFETFVILNIKMRYN